MEQFKLGRQYTWLSDSLTVPTPLVTLWDIMETRFQPYASAFLEHVGILERFIISLQDRQVGDDHKNAQNFMNAMEKSCDVLISMTRSLGLPVTTDRFLDATSQIWLSGSLTAMKQSVKEALNALPVELKSIQFLPVGLESQKYLEANFGALVSKAFPDCIDDIEEAHACFALGRHTASMFHLGRIMEAVTKLLGKKMKAKAPSKDDWQGWIFAIDVAINAMPHKPQSARNKRSLFSEARNYLFNFKEAWRNKTMHPGRTFTPDQARVIMQGAEAFLQSVATNIFKVKASVP